MDADRSLQLASAVLAAGGGASDFKTITLVSVLAGSNVNNDVAQLTKQFGARDMKKSVVVFDFLIADSLRLLQRRHLQLPATFVPDAKDGRAISLAIYQSGRSANGTYNVDRTLGTLFSTTLRSELLSDLDAHFGHHDSTTFRAVVSAFVQRVERDDAL